MMHIQAHRLDGVKQLNSPNKNPRPAGTIIDLLVIHGISLPPGVYGGSDIEKLFMNQLDPDAHAYYRKVAPLKVSAHVVIYRDGGITQFVPFDECAWHAGESVYQGRRQCNDFSVGIELEGSDTTPYKTVQYQQLKRIVEALFAAYPSLSKESIVGHAQIAPGRKTDPGDHFEYNFLERY